jgi:hypothetical protein
VKQHLKQFAEVETPTLRSETDAVVPRRIENPDVAACSIGKARAGAGERDNIRRDLMLSRKLAWREHQSSFVEIVADALRNQIVRVNFR